MKKMVIWGIVILSLLLNSCGKSYEEHLTEGSELQDTKQYELALESFKNAITKAESGAQRIAANIQAGNLSSNYLKDLESADQFFQATLADIQDYSSADLRDLAKQALKAQANQAAVDMYSLWFEKFSDSPNVVDVKYELAEVYHKNIRNLKKAIETYGEVVSDYPESEQAPKALFSIGYIYANELDETESASLHYSQFLEKYPNHEMAPSVEFELKYLGKSLEEIPELQHLLTKTS
ncbi:tetratricopeptide repeat protein [bacterium]|nr:tetratricopeptide repeat protein [bacterium]